MKAFSLFAIIIIVGVGIWYWAKQVEEIEKITPSDSIHNIVDNIQLPKSKADYSNKNLSSVPPEIFEALQVQYLDLSQNQLTGALPAEVRHLQNLEALDLSDNQFTGVPAEIGQLKKLTFLDLSNNQITGLPYELGNLQNLETLDLRGNDYSEQDLTVILKSLPSDVQVLR